MTNPITDQPGIPPWSQLPAHIRQEFVSVKWIGSDGVVWPLAGLDGGVLGAFITGPIDGMVHVPWEGIWTKPAWGPPRFERTVDGRREITFRLALYSDHELGWVDVESRWWRGCRRDQTGFFTLTTRRFGELWLPMQLLEAPKCALETDPMMQKVALHDVTLAVDGEPQWRRPDGQPAPVKRPTGDVDKMILRVANRSLESPAWPIFIIEAPAGGISHVFLPDGPNAFTTDRENPFDDWPRLAGLFGIPILDQVLKTTTRTRTAHMIEIPPLEPGNHVLIDTDPTHRIAISVKDPIDNILKKYIRNSELLNWLTGQYGDSGLPIAQQFHGQGFSIPIPPRSVASLPVQHNRARGRIWVQLPQRFETALG